LFGSMSKPTQFLCHRKFLGAQCAEAESSTVYLASDRHKGGSALFNAVALA
jgi:hypothetical protein